MPTSPAPAVTRAPILRSARPRDLERLWRLDQLCFERGIAYSRRALRRFLEMARTECVVAERGRELRGFALGYPDPPDQAHVVTLDVHPSFRRRGLGRLLIESLLERFTAAGADRAVLEVDVRNGGAIAFYRVLGFRESGRLASYYGPGLDAFEMVKAPGAVTTSRAPDSPSRRAPAR